MLRSTEFTLTGSSISARESDVKLGEEDKFEFEGYCLPLSVCKVRQHLGTGSIGWDVSVRINRCGWCYGMCRNERGKLEEGERLD